MCLPELDGDVRKTVLKGRAQLLRKLRKLARGDAGLANFAFASARGLHALARSGGTKADIRAVALEAADAVATKVKHRESATRI
ncbi:MAG: hypothetical protein CVT79_17315 [Alphaproteobacteria bacterium HGW-Alphaproteobacteria-18]|nr:MAG: hypothetical protein CVT79_17315 [Alphaproteobacteria bacterium HGW-Alphaproteobacteria-18]